MSTVSRILSYAVCMDKKTFGEWLDDEYRDRGLKQKEFAALVGVSNKTVSGWVNGVSYPTDDNFMNIAEVLGLDLNEVRRRAGRRELRIDKDLRWKVEGRASLTSQTQMASASAEVVSRRDRIVRFFTENADELSDEDLADLEALIERRRQARDGG